MSRDALELLGQVLLVASPYAITWRVGIYVFNTLIDWVTGRGDKL